MFKNLVLLLLFVCGFLFGADASIAKIAKVEGSVKILKAGSIKKLNASAGDDIFNSDIVITGDDSKALVKMSSGTTIVVSPQSKIEFKTQNNIAQNEGKAHYSVNKMASANSFKVATDFATIGVKGTEFIVSTNKDDQRVSLKKGLVDLESNSGDFEIHKKATSGDYAEFAQKMQGDYQKYESETKKEFIEYKKTFELKPSKSVSFNGNKLFENGFNEKISQEFKDFEKFK